MAIDWQKIASIVDEKAIQLTGRTATYRVDSTSGPSYDPSAGAPTDTPINVTEGSFDSFVRSGTVIVQGDFALIAATPADGTVIESGNKIVDGGVVYRIKQVMRIKPGSDVVAYEILAAR